MENKAEDARIEGWYVVEDKYGSWGGWEARRSYSWARTAHGGHRSESATCQERSLDCPEEQPSAYFRKGDAPEAARTSNAILSPFPFWLPSCKGVQRKTCSCSQCWLPSGHAHSPILIPFAALVSIRPALAQTPHQQPSYKAVPSPDTLAPRLSTSLSSHMHKTVTAQSHPTRSHHPDHPLFAITCSLSRADTQRTHQPPTCTYARPPSFMQHISIATPPVVTPKCFHAILTPPPQAQGPPCACTHNMLPPAACTR